MEPKVKPKSFTYDVDVRWVAERKGRMGADGKPTLEVATPPEFKGHPGIWSPEDLFVSAVNVCTMSTFLTFAIRHNVKFLDYRSHARGLLEKVDDKYRFTEITVEPVVTLPEGGDAEEAREALHMAHEHCLIANSISARVVMNEKIEFAGGDQK
ncbi:MAG: OsmC family protein [Acidobacteriota bacterium]